MAQSDKHFVGWGIGYGDMIQQQGLIADFSTLKWNLLYLQEKRHLAIRVGYANWQASAKTKNITQNSLDLGIGYHHQHPFGSSNLILGTTFQYAYGVASQQIFNMWKVGFVGLLNQRIRIDKKKSFFHELEYTTNFSYNTISYIIGLTFHLKTTK
jgi:hypothetical protein